MGKNEICFDVRHLTGKWDKGIHKGPEVRLRFKQKAKDLNLQAVPAHIIDQLPSQALRWPDKLLELWNLYPGDRFSQQEIPGGTPTSLWSLLQTVWYSD